MKKRIKKLSLNKKLISKLTINDYRIKGGTGSLLTDTFDCSPPTVTYNNCTTVDPNFVCNNTGNDCWFDTKDGTPKNNTKDVKCAGTTDCLIF